MTPAPLRATWGGSGTPQTWFSDKAPDERTGKRTSSGSSSAGSSTAGASWGTSIICSSWGASACRVPTRDEKKVEMLMVVCSACTFVRNSVDRHVAAVPEFRRRFGNFHPSTTPTHPSPQVLLVAPFPHKAQHHPYTYSIDLTCDHLFSVVFPKP